ncbi:gastrula zinc finger protein XlCGF8.2DB-like [Aricia agestis]|uniref:gastrula zinc finger protein XlCGF8.2DB-like n=1 Tax=Aricia agestis TaxID=91739 RepID=UPI001C201AAA|nr:gastrula zinc finger protein XlCGF8.2DB-like [Aricia agestis]
MDKCGICLKPAVQLFETGKDEIYACFKCQPLVPEVTIGDNAPETSEQGSNNEEEIGEGESGLSCGLCHKTFTKNAQLQNHLRNHRAERRFVCTYCNKAFSQSNNLRAHLRIHTNERPYKCQECGKAFTQVTNLNNHVRLHTGERPFVCPEPGCDKAYAQVTNLNQHRKRHLSGRPLDSSYDCPVCGERFAQRNHMYMHRREAHGDVTAKSAWRVGRYECKLCALTLPSERQLRQHLARHLPVAPAAAAVAKPAEESESEAVYTCVFSSCGSRFDSPREHTEHLLRAHQLRVLSARATTPPRRGRPPKMSAVLKDPLDLTDQSDEYDEVKIIKEEPPQFVSKLKVSSLFQ